MGINMKTNTTIFMGDSSRHARHAGMQEQKSEEKQNKEKSKSTIYAGDLNQKQDNILLRKQQLQKKAMKVFNDAYANEVAMDDEIKEHRANIEVLREDSSAANANLNEVKASISQVQQSYGVKDDSAEQADTELLLKERQANRPGANVKLTEEEKTRLAEMGPLTEYQQTALRMDEGGDAYRTQMEENQRALQDESDAIRGIKNARLKSHAMVDAANAKDDMMEEAAKEIAFLYLEEAKEHIDEERKEQQETAQQKAEKEQEKEEQLEAARENKEQTQEHTEEIKESVQIQMTDNETTQTDMDVKLKKLLEEAKLVEEDLKGLNVDEQL